MFTKHIYTSIERTMKLKEHHRKFITKTELTERERERGNEIESRKSKYNNINGNGNKRPQNS